jgi:acetyl-CoA carboxylase carboxyl transferase subunit beta
MNWLTRAINFGEKVKKILKKRPSKQDTADSDWTSCCKGPVLKKDLEENLWVCNSCGKQHRITCRQRFDIFFGKNSYEILETPIPTEDPLNWKATKA